MTLNDPDKNNIKDPLALQPLRENKSPHSTVKRREVEGLLLVLNIEQFKGEFPFNSVFGLSQGR